MKPREEHVGETVFGGRGNGMMVAPSPTMASVMAGDLPMLKHCMEDAASAEVMHLDEPPVTKKKEVNDMISTIGECKSSNFTSSWTTCYHSSTIKMVDDHTIR